jgi:2-polyprenyl-6-methoxyphenol hydroxylase-like FAD-dependent oxidoreductase
MTEGFRGVAREPSRPRHAVVIGGGLSGLLAARALVGHVERITVLDRDRFPGEPVHRAGVPQSHHAHGLGLRGRDVIAELFPGIQDELLAEGAELARDSVPLQVVTPAGVLPLAPLPEFIVFGRVLLEHVIRRRVAGYGQVRFRPGTEATGLRPNLSGSRVDGVHVRSRDTGERYTLGADLVVDASGRGSRAPEWLRALGCAEVPEEVISSGVGYASRYYAKPDGWPDDWQMIVVNGRAPDNRRAGLILGIDNGQWHVTLGGMVDAVPPTDDEGFLRWARDLPDPSVYEAIRVARPLGPVRGWRCPTNRLRHFERLRRWPAGFVVTGDAVCASNPIYAQGMSVAATDALVLAETLSRHDGGAGRGFAADFQRRLARNVAAPWLEASTEDLRWAGVTLRGGRRRFAIPLVQRYLDPFLRAAVRDPVLAERYYQMIMLAVPPGSLFTPAAMARIARVAIGGRLGVPVRRHGLSARSLAAVRAMPDFAPTGVRPAAQL